MLIGGILLLALGGAGLFLDHPDAWKQYADLIHGGAIVALVIGTLLVLADITERFSILASGSLVLAGGGIAAWQLGWVPSWLWPWLLGALIVVLAIGAVLFLIGVGVALADETLVGLGGYLAVLGVITLVVAAVFDLGGWDRALVLVGTLLLTAAPAPVLMELADEQPDSSGAYEAGLFASVGFSVATTSVVTVNVFDEMWTWITVLLIIVAVLGYLATAGGLLVAFLGGEPAPRTRPEPDPELELAAEAPQVLGVVSPPVPRSLARLRTQPDGAYRLLPRIE